jgi:hypothetical protein
MSFTDKNIFELLPAVYRIRDAEQGGPLQALIEIIAEQAKIAENDIARLYDNWFIETCEEWVVPYIGDLLGVRNLNAISGSSVISQRAYVANTISYRRRKGIAPVLEQLSMDVAGWRAHVVEFFELLATSQYMNHVRLHRPLVPDLRNMNQLDLLNTAFDTIAHSADMRHISSGRGKYNISNIGLFIWRLQNYPVTRSDAHILYCPLSPPSVNSEFFTFDPLGNNTQLFNQPKTETSITHLSEEINIPGLLRRRALFDELEARRQAIVDGVTPIYNYFDDRLAIEDEPETKKHPVFEIFPNGSDNPVPPEEILIINLENCCTPPTTKKYKKLMNDGSYTDVDKQITVAVDPVLGRFIFTDPGSVLKAEVSYSYGFSGDVGSGPYNRQDSVLDFLSQKITWQVGVSKNITSVAGESIFPDLTMAVTEWNVQPSGTFGIITIMDSHTYPEDLTINIPEKSQLLIIAAGWPERLNSDLVPERFFGDLAARDLRPHLYGNIKVIGNVLTDSGLPDHDKKTGGELTLNGLLIEGKLTVVKGNLGVLTLAHSTLVPGSGGLEAGADTADPLSNQWLKIILRKSICGSVNLHETNAVLLDAEDSILDHSADWAILAINTPTELKSTTLYGKVHVKTLHAENCIFKDTVNAERRQTGCIRFSYLPGKNPETPRRFRCQPELEITTRIAEAEKTGHLSSAKKNQMSDDIRDWLVPGFSWQVYGHHAYAQLNSGCPKQITDGSDNGSEMGVFRYLQQPQRQANLRIALDEYLPLGLEAGIMFVT